MLFHVRHPPRKRQLTVVTRAKDGAILSSAATVVWFCSREQGIIVLDDSSLRLEDSQLMQRAYLHKICFCGKYLLLGCIRCFVGFRNALPAYMLKIFVLSGSAF